MTAILKNGSGTLSGCAGLGKLTGGGAQKTRLPPATLFDAFSVQTDNSTFRWFAPERASFWLWLCHSVHVLADVNGSEKHAKKKQEIYNLLHRGNGKISSEWP